MKISKIAAAAAIALSAATSASAFTLVNSSGSYSDFFGFDWAQGGAAWTSGLGAAETGLAAGCPTVASCQFTINYAAWAVGVTDADGNGIFMPLDSRANGVLNPGTQFEYTIMASMTGTLIGGSSSAINYVVGPGTFSVYYDTAATANLNHGAWTGFNDGIVILSGDLMTVVPQQFSLTNAISAISLVGAVNYTNSAYITPAVGEHTLSSTLQLYPSFSSTTFTPPTSVNGVPVNTNPNVENIFQADANTSLRASVSEPGSLALAGLAVLGAGLAARRRRV